MDGGKAWDKIKGVKLVIYHPNDILVPFEASMASQCSAKEKFILDPHETGFSTHFAPIEYHRTATGTSAIDMIAMFLAH